MTTLKVQYACERGARDRVERLDRQLRMVGVGIAKLRADEPACVLYAIPSGSAYAKLLEARSDASLALARAKLRGRALSEQREALVGDVGLYAVFEPAQIEAEQALITLERARLEAEIARLTRQADEVDPTPRRPKPSDEKLARFKTLSRRERRLRAEIIEAERTLFKVRAALVPGHSVKTSQH